MLARSCISVGTGDDEKEARRCMSPRLPTFAKNKGVKARPPAQLACKPLGFSLGNRFLLQHKQNVIFRSHLYILTQVNCLSEAHVVF